MTSDNTAAGPAISIVMSIYNEPEEWLRTSIDSMLSQTLSDFEFIIINDHPERQLNCILLNEYLNKDNRIVIHNNDQNIGLTRSLNKGLILARGKYIARMDGDDISLPDRLFQQFEFMEAHEDIVACGAWAETFGSKKSEVKKHLKISHNEIASHFCIYSPFLHPTLFLRNSTIKEHGIRYNESYLRAQDYGLALDLLKVGKLANLPEILILYRISSSQASKKHAADQLYTAQRIRREFIEHVFTELKFHVNLPKEIDVKFIETLRQIQKTNSTYNSLDKENKGKFSRILNSIRMVLLLSMNKYSVKGFLIFILSFDYLHHPYNVKRALIIIYKHFHPSKWPNHI